MSIKEDITILLVTYVPYIDFLKEKIQLYKDFKIIIVDASPNEHRVEKNLSLSDNISIYKINNNGQGFANNTGIKSAKSKYVLYIDLDADFSLEKVSQIYKYANDIKKWSILIPNSNKKFSNDDVIEIDNCESSVFLVNREVVIKNEMFDEKIFFYFEELDYYSRLNLTDYKVFLLPKLNFLHNQGGSVDKSLIKDVSNLQQWHYLWSMYYVYKKKTNFLNALKIIFPYVFKDIIKLLFYLIILNFKSANKRLYRLSGAINSVFGKSSYKRPKNI